MSEQDQAADPVDIVGRKPDEKPKPPAPKVLRRGRWLKRILALLLAMMFVLAFQAYLLPNLAQRILLGRLAAMGLPEARLQVRNAGLRSVEIADVKADDAGSIQVERMFVRYSPLSLLRGEVKEIEVTGLDVRVRVRGGRVHFGALDGLRTSGGKGSRRSPIRKVSLRSCTLLVQRMTNQTRVLFDGVAHQGDDGNMHVEINAGIPGAEGHLTATYVPEEQEISFELDASPSALRKMAAAFLGVSKPFAEATWSNLDIDVAGSISRGKVHIAASVEGEAVSWRRPGGEPIAALGQIHCVLALGPDPAGGRFTLEAEDVRIGNALTPKLLTIDLPIHVKPRREGLRLELASGSRIRLEGRAGEALEAAKDPPAIISIEGACDFQTDGWDAKLGFRHDAKEEFRPTLSPVIGMAVRGLQMDVAVRQSYVRSSHEVSLEARAQRCTAQVKGYEIVTTNPVFTVDPQEGDSPGLRSQLSIAMDRIDFRQIESGATFKLEKTSLKPISGTYDWSKRRADLETVWMFQDEAPLRGNVVLDFGGSRPIADLSADCSGIDLKKARETIGLFLDLSDFDIAGDLTVRSRLRFREGALRPRVELTLEDASLRSLKYQAAAEDVRASVTVTGFDPLATPGNQRITIGKARLGSLQVHDGLVAFRLESDPATVLIERTEWQWLKGRLYHYLLRFDPNQPRIDFRIFADSIDLGELLQLLMGPTTRGQGTLYGMLSVSLSCRNPADVRFGRGFLYAHPDGGWWQIRGKTAGKVKTLFAKALSAVGGTGRQAERNRERILQGLLGFAFTTLKAEFIEREDGLLARVTTRGESRDKGNPVQYEGLVLDFPRFDGNLRKAIIIDVVLSRAQEILKKRSGK